MNNESKESFTNEQIEKLPLYVNRLGSYIQCLKDGNEVAQKPTVKLLCHLMVIPQQYPLAVLSMTSYQNLSIKSGILGKKRKHELSDLRTNQGCGMKIYKTTLTTTDQITIKEIENQIAESIKAYRLKSKTKTRNLCVENAEILAGGISKLAFMSHYSENPKRTVIVEAFAGDIHDNRRKSCDRIKITLTNDAVLTIEIWRENKGTDTDIMCAMNARSEPEWHAFYTTNSHY